jgi:lysyl-tRNA synthetase class II
MPEKFLAALSRGLPPAAGIALGVDRLLMLLIGAPRLADTLPFPEEV